jgi:hypothetical protein
MVSSRTGRSLCEHAHKINRPVQAAAMPRLWRAASAASVVARGWAVSRMAEAVSPGAQIQRRQASATTRVLDVVVGRGLYSEREE